MDVRSLGFSISVEGNGISIEDLFEYFISEKCVKNEDYSNPRRIYINKSENKQYYCGLIVTIRNQKVFCRLADENESLTIEVENLKGDDKLLEFNFFAVNRENGLGIYQHYHQSCSINIFGEYLKKYFRIIRESRINTAISILKAQKNYEPSEKEKSKIRSSLKAQLAFSPLYKKGDLEKILSGFKAIKQFEFEYAFLESDSKPAVPLSKYVKRRREKLTFSQEYGVKQIGNAITNFINKERPKSGRIFVEDFSGDTLPIKIFDMPDHFGCVNYDDLAVKLHGLDVKEFSKHKIIDELISTMESDDYEHIFGAEIA